MDKDWFPDLVEYRNFAEKMISRKGYDETKDNPRYRELSKMFLGLDIVKMLIDRVSELEAKIKEAEIKGNEGMK